MILAFHVVFTTYGTWLPNDPRGSYSKETYNRALGELGPIRYGRQDPQPSLGALKAFWTAALPCLKRPPYFIDDLTRPVIAEAFHRTIVRLSLLSYACAIMNDHVHMVLGHDRRRIDYLIGQLKAAATHDLGLPETPWAQHAWKVFLTDDAAVRAAIHYVENNPVVARMSSQHWSFVTPFGTV